MRRYPIIVTLVLLFASFQLPSAVYSSGSAVFDPATLNAGQDETFRLVYTAGEGGLPEGTTIAVQDPNFHGMGWTIFQRFQTDDPNESGYLTVSSTNEDVTLSLTRDEPASVNDPSYSVITIESGAIYEGDSITLTYGDTTDSPEGAALTPHKAYEHIAWLVSIDTGSGPELLQRQPLISIQAKTEAEHMFATAPTYVQIGVPFDLTVRVLDEYGNPCNAYSGMFTFTSTDNSADLPSGTNLPSGTGYQRFSAILKTPGIHYIYVDDSNGFSINSNPVVVMDALPSKQIFWGDLHGHHGYVNELDGNRIDQYIEYARNVSDLDFATESAKSSTYWNVPETWEEVEESVFLYESRDFLPLLGFEWMGKNRQGHHNIYYLATSGPQYSPDDSLSDTLDKLYLRVAEDNKEALIIPHASSYTGHNWSRIQAADLNARFRRLAEIYSHWDSSEETDPGSVRAGWAAGNRMGVIACTDGHYCFPGTPLSDEGPEGEKAEGGPATGYEGYTVVGGLTAVRAPYSARHHLWQGLKQRHTYATDGARIFLDFGVDGHPMGEEYRTSTPPHIQVEAAGTAEIEIVEVFRGTYAEDPENMESTENYYETVYTVAPGALTTALEFDDTGFNKDCFYYVRVTQVDGHRAWSSPVWVDYGSAPLDLWAQCGNSVSDPGENLVTCAPDTQLAPISQVQMIDGKLCMVANGVPVPMTGLYVYNVSNVDSFVPYGDDAWLEFMMIQVDRVKFAAGHYLGFHGFGMSLYDGPEYPTAEQMNDPDNWNWDLLDSVFDYAAKEGVYLILTISVDQPPPWWQRDHTEAMQTDEDGQLWNTVTFNNPDYWALADVLLEVFVNHYKDQPALLAWDFRVGQGENNYAPPYTVDVFNPPDAWCDYSEKAVSNFRDWLTAKYGDDEALKAAWRDPRVTLATAEIPFRSEMVEPATVEEVILLINGPGDIRPDFYDWYNFRLDEKIAETQHFAELFSNLDPDRVTLSDPANVPLSKFTTMQGGTMDGETLYRSPYIDAVVHHPRIGHTDQANSFNSQRIGLCMTDQYAIHNGVIALWVNEETSEVIDPDGDQENIWRLNSIAALNASMGQGCGWVIGSTTDPMLPAWSYSEQAEIGRLAGLYSAPGLEGPQPKIAVLADPRGEIFDYYIGGPMAFPYLIGSDRGTFLDALWANGMNYDILSVDNVRIDPGVLDSYKGILVMNIPRLPLDVAQHLADFRDSGGGLLIGGRTGIFDGLGKPDPASLETLLDASITGMHRSDLKTWAFDDIADPLLLGGLQNTTYAEDNLYYIPIFDLAASGYKAIGHLTDVPEVATAGRKGNTVFWFPRLRTVTPESMITFQRNLWRLFGVEARASARKGVEATGANYLSIFSAVDQVVIVNYPPEMAGALVWDWMSMQLMGTIPEDGELAVQINGNSTVFLGTVVTEAEPQLVAISRASLAGAENLTESSAFAIKLYRAVPGLQAQVAVHPGELHIKDAVVNGASLDYAGYEETGQVYVVQFTPNAELVTVTLGFEMGEEPVAIKGDVNGDGQINSADAILALRISAGMMETTEDQEWAADMNSDGAVRSNDAILILRKATGLSAPGADIVASANRNVSISLPEAHGISGETITVPVTVDTIQLLSGGDISISYDQKVLRLVDISSDTGAILLSSVQQSGTVRIAFAAYDSMRSKTIARIQFHIIADEASPLVFDRVNLYGPDALSLTTRYTDGSFGSWAMKPKFSALAQNFPNPFNPETWIPYQLSEDNIVTIRIFNTSGALIRELDLGHKPAGFYVSRDRAAYWDGRNECGEKVASGIYFYSIHAGDLAAVKKMVVLE